MNFINKSFLDLSKLPVYLLILFIVIDIFVPLTLVVALLSGYLWSLSKKFKDV